MSDDVFRFTRFLIGRSSGGQGNRAWTLEKPSSAKTVSRVIHSPFVSGIILERMKRRSESVKERAFPSVQLEIVRSMFSLSANREPVLERSSAAADSRNSSSLSPAAVRNLLASLCREPKTFLLDARS